MKEFEISVIMPVFNTGAYIDEAVASILNQTLGFEEHVELIFINDASSDNSDSICKRYLERYPDNVRYLSFEENHGAAFSRNKGIEAAAGRYVVFTDSDDKWSENAFERAVCFLKMHGAVIDLVSVNISYFEGAMGEHILNTDEADDTIVDINKDFGRIRTTVPCFIKGEVAKCFRFNEEQHFREDTAYVNSVILQRQKYGMLGRDVAYYYRKRENATSIAQNYFKEKGFYFKDAGLLFDTLYRESVRVSGRFLPMMQCLIAFDIENRFRERLEALDEKEMEAYFRILYDILQFIDDDIFCHTQIDDKGLDDKIILLKHNEGLIRIFAQDKFKDRQLVAARNDLGKFRLNYSILNRLYSMRLQGRGIDNYFLEKGFCHIAIYGFAGIGKILYEELKNTAVAVEYVIDQNAAYKREEMQQKIPVFAPEDELPDNVDAIVVTAAYYFNDIRNVLKNKVCVPVISVEDIA